jgi:hypothetical protein
MQLEHSVINEGHLPWQIGEPRVPQSHGYGHPQDATSPDILNFDRIACIISPEMYLQHGQTVSLQETVIQMPQILFDSAGRTLPLDMRVPHDRNSIQGARGNGEIIVDPDLWL